MGTMYGHSKQSGLPGNFFDTAIAMPMRLTANESK